MTHVEVDRTLCQGYGNCVIAAPQVFDLDDAGQAVVVVDSISEDEQRSVALAAASVCPVSAIAVKD